jgi:GT2 family glycosyltransferase
MTRNKLVSVNVLTYNGQDLIESCLGSVARQTYKNVEVLVIDNNSQDDTLGKIRNLPIRIIENKENLGFSAGHNIGIRESRGEYVLCLNQDVALDKDFIKNAVEAIEVDGKIAAVQGKLLKINDVIDATGLVMFKNRRIIGRGQGEKDKGQYKRGEIFGADGAAPLYRRSALEDVKLPIFKGGAPSLDCFEYFDENFFMYKEDVDLAWRMRLYGWKAIYEPTAIAYHLRGAGEKAVRTPIAIIKGRLKLSKFAKFYSFKNKRLMQVKNELPGLFFCHFYCIIINEMAAWGYVLFFETYTLKVIKSLIKEVPTAWRKRKIIMKRKKIGTKEMKKWFQ